MEIDEEVMSEIIDQRYPVQGMLVYRKLGIFIIREMQRMLEKMLEDAGHEPVLFPVLIPEDLLEKEKDHIKGFEDEVFWVTMAGKNNIGKKLALRPTSETPIYTMFSMWIRSHKDLPMKVHQTCAVYRYETKQTRPLIRGREFLWNEGHSAFKNLSDAEKNIIEIKKIYGKLLDALGIPFMLNKRPEWDKFPGAEYTLAFDTIINGRTLQIATIHNLSEDFSKAFDIKFENEQGDHDFVRLTCYGPSFGRLLHRDDRGIIIPPEFSPVQVVIVPIFFKENHDIVLEYTKKVEKALLDKNLRVKVDLSDKRPGEKYYFWEKHGVCLRIEIGLKEVQNNDVVVVRRDAKEKIRLKLDNLEQIEKILCEIKENIKAVAEKKFKEHIFNAKTLDELNKFAGKGIALTGLCNNKECIEKVEAIGDVLGVSEKECKCVVCGKKGIEISFGKAY